MTLRPILFPFALFLCLGTLPQSSAGETWKAEIVLNFRAPGDLYPGSEGRLVLRLENRRVVGRFRSSSLVPSTESLVRGRFSGRLDPSATRQRISMKLRCLREGFGEIDLDGVLTSSGNQLRFKGRRMVWTEPRSGFSLPDHYVARLHRTQDDFDLLKPSSTETVEKFLERVDFEFETGYRTPYQVIPYRRKVLIPTDEKGFWSMPLTHQARARGKFRSGSLTTSGAGTPFSGRAPGSAPTSP